VCVCVCAVRDCREIHGTPLVAAVVHKTVVAVVARPSNRVAIVAAVAAVAGIVSPLPSGLSHGTPGIAVVLQTSRGPRRRRLMVMIGNGHTQRPSAGTYLYGFFFLSFTRLL